MELAQDILVGVFGGLVLKGIFALFPKSNAAPAFLSSEVEKMKAIIKDQNDNILELQDQVDLLSGKKRAHEDCIRPSDDDLSDHKTDMEPVPKNTTVKKPKLVFLPSSLARTYDMFDDSDESEAGDKEDDDISNEDLDMSMDPSEDDGVNNPEETGEEQSDDGAMGKDDLYQDDDDEAVDNDNEDVSKGSGKEDVVAEVKDTPEETNNPDEQETAKKDDVFGAKEAATEAEAIVKNAPDGQAQGEIDSIACITPATPRKNSLEFCTLSLTAKLDAIRDRLAEARSVPGETSTLKEASVYSPAIPYRHYAPLPAMDPFIPAP